MDESFKSENKFIPKINEIKKTRDSNLELFRIVTMILIIAHHYVVNSGLTSVGGPIFSDPMSFKSIFFIIVWGMGKNWN